MPAEYRKIRLVLILVLMKKLLFCMEVNFVLV